MQNLLQSVVANIDEYVEIRYHKRIETIIDARSGALRKVERRTLAGAGVRSLVDGCWGFVSTTDVSKEEMCIRDSLGYRCQRRLGDRPGQSLFPGYGRPDT